MRLRFLRFLKLIAAPRRARKAESHLERGVHAPGQPRACQGYET
jgi:hypothetical protein